MLDSRFLFAEAVAARAPTVVEIGTASGVSSAILAQAQAAAHDAGLIDGARVVSYDISPMYYANPELPVGAAVEEMVETDVAARVEFRNPAGAVDLPRLHEPDELRFVFIDASHSHPWPTLDLLAILPVVAPGASVLMHDINLPVIHPQFPDWGAKHVFDGLEVEKCGNPDDDPPNIGKIVIPDDKEGLREQLVAIARAHEWEVEPDPAVVQQLLEPA